MSGGEIAALIAAVAFVLLVGLLAVPILKLGRTLDQATKLLVGINEQTIPLLVETRQSLAQVNEQLARVDTITTHAQTVTSNVANLSSAFTAVLGGPLVKASALAYGVRRAVRGRREAEVNKRVKAEMKGNRGGLLRRRGRRAAGED